MAKTALICDDNFYVCRFLFEILEGAGFVVSIVRDGKETEKILSGFKNYDIAFVDIIMPKSYGTEAVELANVFGNHTPIVFMSGLAVLEQDEIKDCHFIAKPFTTEQIKEAINKVLNKD